MFYDMLSVINVLKPSSWILWRRAYVREIYQMYSTHSYVPGSRFPDLNSNVLWWWSNTQRIRSTATTNWYTRTHTHTHRHTGPWLLSFERSKWAQMTGVEAYSCYWLWTEISSFTPKTHVSNLYCWHSFIKKRWWKGILTLNLSKICEMVVNHGVFPPVFVLCKRAKLSWYD